jgi:hypothetical protein
MKRFFIFFLLLSTVYRLLSTNVYAVDCTTERCSACDQCGYCWQLTPTPPFLNPPSDWEKCRDCLYTLPGTAAESNETLKINEADNLPPTPMPGKMYTQLGCLGTNLAGFQEEGAAAGVVQTLLNVIFSIVGGVGFLFMLYAAFIIMTSQANPERMNYGKKVLVGAIVGVIFSLSIVFIINLLGSGVLKIPGFGTTP